jgi:hypothetical protein
MKATIHAICSKHRLLTMIKIRALHVPLPRVILILDRLNTRFRVQIKGLKFGDVTARLYQILYNYIRETH